MVQRDEQVTLIPSQLHNSHNTKPGNTNRFICTKPTVQNVKNEIKIVLNSTAGWHFLQLTPRTYDIYDLFRGYKLFHSTNVTKRHQNSKGHFSLIPQLGTKNTLRPFFIFKSTFELFFKCNIKSLSGIWQQTKKS